MTPIKCIVEGCVNYANFSKWLKIKGKRISIAVCHAHKELAQ